MITHASDILKKSDLEKPIGLIWLENIRDGKFVYLVKNIPKINLAIAKSGVDSLRRL